MRSSNLGFVLAISAGLSACGGGGSTPPPQGSTPPPVYSVSGTVSGLTGTLVLRVNDATDVNVSANGAVTLASSLANGASYSVTVKTQPSSPTQHCDLANATGTVASANVTNLTVTCAAVPLTLASSTPASGATGVTRDAPLTLTFSTAIDASAASVALTGPAGDVATSTQVSGTQFVITPTKELVKLGAYSLTVDGVKGTGGELLAAPIALGFESADGTWSAPVALGTQAGDASYARIAMDAKGNGLAVWVQTAGGISGLVANHWNAGTGWDGPQRIDGIDFKVPTMPEVHFDHDGNALALWVQGTAFQQAIWSNRFDASGTWSSARQISAGKVDAAWPTFAFDVNGGALGLWENVGRATPDGEAFDYFPSLGWTGAGFPIVNRAVSSMHVCMDSTGRAQVVFTAISGSSTQIVARSHVKGSWTGSVILQEVTGSVDSLRIVCPATGGAVAAWVSPGTTAHHARASWLTDAGWAEPVTLDASTIGVSKLSLSSDATGNTLIVWSQVGSIGAELWTRRAGTDHLWSPALRIDDPAAGPAIEPELALDAAGNGWAVWRVAPAGKPSRISAARVRHGEFAAPLIIDPDTAVDAAGANVALDPDGNAIAVWLRCQSNCYVMASRFE